MMPKRLTLAWTFCNLWDYSKKSLNTQVVYEIIYPRGCSR